MITSTEAKALCVISNQPLSIAYYRSSFNSNLASNGPFLDSSSLILHTGYMKRVAALLIFSGLFVVFTGKISAQILYPQFSQSRGTSVSATVGTNYLTIKGYHSPYASIILKTQSGVFLASTTADSEGYFTISNILINASEKTYCFQAVDFRRAGLSEACVTLPDNIGSNYTFDNIFLPPTIGLSKKVINEGEDAVIYGYSMPNATVFLNIDGKVITVTANAEGYYSYVYVDVPSGSFHISATANLGPNKSLAPTNEVILQAVSVTEQITDTIVKNIPKPPKKETFDLLPYLLAGILLLAAIGILLYKLRLRLWVILIDFLRRKKKMHHDWFLDKW